TRDLPASPMPEVAELLGTQHFWILHTHPVAALAYFYVIEGNPPTVQMLDWMVETAGVPRDALRTFYRHATIDIEHGRELEDLVDSLPLTEAHQEMLAVSATTVLRQLARIMERHVNRADELLAADALIAPSGRLVTPGSPAIA
ncbi:MAG: iron-containing redox enzyme family protein, partial [Gemmatimonadaceae bacterium]